MANLIVTDAGIAAIRNAQASGTNAVYIESIKIGSSKWTPDETATDLQSVIKTYTAVAGGAVGDNVIHVEAIDTTDDSFTAYELGVFLDDGTLLAVQSSTTPILEKSSASQALLAIDVLISGTEDVEFVCPDPDFQVPPATTETMGVVELATPEEGLEGTDAVRAMTPLAVKAVADTRAPVNHASSATTYGTGTATAHGHVRLSDATDSTLNAGNATAATPLAVKSALDAAIQADTLKVAKAGDTVTGAIHSTAGGAAVDGTVAEQFGGEMAGTDKWRLGAGGTASGAGFLELATSGAGDEPVYVAQYAGASRVRQVALLDGSGKTAFPVEVSAPSFVGELTGNASTATKLRTARSITVKDNSQANAGPAQAFDGSSDVTLRLPAVIKGTLDGNAATATKATQDKNGLQIDTGYLKLAGGTVSGTLVLSRTTDLSGTADNGPALVIGGTRAQAHIEIDNNEIQAKANGTSTGALYLQPDGGICNVNGKRVVRGTGGSGTKPVYVDGDGNVVASGSTVGGTARGVFLSGGNLTAMSANVGGANQPVYLSGGTVKACNAYSTVSMIPNGWSGRSNGTTYTAGSNGYVYGRNSKWATCGKTTKLVVNGVDYWLQTSSYGSGSCQNDHVVIVPIRKGQTYRAYNLNAVGFISAS